MQPPTLLLVMNFKPRLHRPLEHWLLGIARGLQARGGRLHVVLSADPVEWWADEFGNVGDFTVVPQIRERWVAAAVAPVLKRVRPQALAFIFIPMGHPGTWWLARFAPGASGLKRRLYLDHNSWEVSAKSGVKAVLARLRGGVTSWVFDEFISISQFNRQRNIKGLHIAAEKNRLIYNGVLEPQPSAGGGMKSARQPYAFYVGQLMREKGVHTLLRAWARLREADAPGHPLHGVQLWLAGAGKEEAQMRTLASELGLLAGDVPAVVFLGLRDDVPELMRGALANVIPSEWAEGFGLTAAEALASGRPIVVSDAGALPEVVGDCGFIFPKGDADALAETLQRAISAGAALTWDPAPLQTRYQDNFRLEQMVANYVDRFVASLDLETAGQ